MGNFLQVSDHKIVSQPKSYKYIDLSAYNIIASYNQVVIVTGSNDSSYLKENLDFATTFLLFFSEN